MKGYDAYRMYLAMRNHFKTKTYDFARNQFAKAKQETYDKRKDKYFFIKLSRKYNEEELAKFYLANFVQENSEWIGAMTANGERNYVDYIRKLQSLSYIFQNDAHTMKESCDNFNDLFTGKPHPTLIKLWMGGKIQLESVVIMEKMFEFCKNVTATDPVWQDAKTKILKYEPLLKTSTDKHRSVLKELYL